MTPEECRAEAVATAEAILRGDLDTLHGAQRLAGLRYEWDAESDEDFLLMAGVASDIDHLPSGPEREYWDTAALAEKDEEWREASDWHGESVRAACHRIVERYGHAVRDS